MGDPTMTGETRWDELVDDYGLTPYNRRLADKILNAYNQAAALDRHDLAEMLLQALKACIATDEDQRNAGAIQKAHLWQQFVDSRNRYKDVRHSHQQQSPEVLAALETMKHAYTAWNDA
jgi:hypothetical protein